MDEGTQTYDTLRSKSKAIVFASPVELTLGDYVTGRDPVLQAALTHTP